jgi:endo-1,4-beta-D-glucanase Y
MSPARSFPPPWTSEDHNDACFIVKDANGVAVAYVYYEEEPGRRAAANLMTKEEARRIAAIIVKLPDLLRRLRTWAFLEDAFP